MTRPRIGCIVPGPNIAAEDDFIAMAPPGVGVHFHRMDVEVSPDLERIFTGMVEAAPRLARTLASAEVGVVAFACTSASFFRGPGSDRAIGQAMEAAAGVPAVPTSTAVVDALKAFGAKRIAVATPYVDWVVEAERRFLEAAGFEVVNITGLGHALPPDVHSAPPESCYAHARASDRPEADILFVSCTDYPVLSMIDRLERDQGKPVVTSNQATYWAAAKRVGAGVRPGYGRLFER